MPTETAPRPFAVVTGASTGIGYHLARVFAENGFDVLITAEESRIADAAQDIEALGGKVYTVQADLTKDEEVKRLWDEILATGPGWRYRSECGYWYGRRLHAGNGIGD